MLKVLDLSTRLPGPLATSILMKYDMEVTKLEIIEFGGDPFKEDPHKNKTHFIDWYRNFNSEKEVIEISLQELKEFVQKNRFDIVIAPAKNKLKEIFNHNQKIKSVLWIAAGKDEYRFLHDLNALALSESFRIHLALSPTPPYIPISGVLFSQMIALEAMHSLLKYRDKTLFKTVYLKDVVSEILDKLNISSFSGERLLHTGKFPCYNIYRSLEGDFICLASIEDRFWNNLCKSFNLEELISKKMDESEKTTLFLRNFFKRLSTNEIRNKIRNKDVCITIVENDIKSKEKL